MSNMTASLGLAVKKRTGPKKALAVPEPNGSDSIPISVTPVSGSPTTTNNDSHSRAFSLSSIKGWRSFSSSKDHKERDSIHSIPENASTRSHSRKISKSRPLSSASNQLNPPSRRGSVISDHSRHSTADSLSLAAAGSPSPIDWKSQHVEGAAPLEADSHLLKTKTPYLVVTTDYLVKMKSRADALALFPALAAEGHKRESSSSGPDPQLVIPVAAIVSVLIAESTRPSFGFEVWSRNPLSGHGFFRSDFFFSQPTECYALMSHLTRAMRASQPEEDGSARQCRDAEGMLNRINEAEEPRFQHRKPEIFPVVPRGSTRKEYTHKVEDAAKKPQEYSAFYLVVGTYLCHLVEIQKVKGGELVCRHKSYGLVALETFNGELVVHEERFNITFRDPFKTPVVLQLASRYYRQIIRVFGTADRFLKPSWPQLWQSREIFHVSGLKETQFLASREDFGSFRQTLDAYLAAYRCEPVDWEINWKTRFAPEFRLLPAKRYSALQLLAVLRALRYNDYFNSLSFKDVDLSVLYGLEDDPSKKTNAAYLSRNCVALDPEEVETLRNSPLLHQEFHALAFCSETIRQIDLRNCAKSLSGRNRTQVPSLQFLAPILHLLRAGVTKCNHLILAGNMLPQADIDDLSETMKTGAIHALDVSSCGLDDLSLRDMVVAPLSGRAELLESLSISGNPGRLPARFLPSLLEYLTHIRELNLSGSIKADSYMEGSLLPFETLQYVETLEELDISGYKLDEATLLDLERFLGYRSWMLDQQMPSKFRKLALNNCGINGTQAARLFHAIGENRGLHLCLSSNPIEDGIEDLVDAIHQQKGPAGLYLEMMEFKEESSYLSLIKALTGTQHLLLLSLAGTAPSPSAHGPCSEELVTTLHDFFARNASIKCLDLSGYSGKLDDGQLPKGFGRSLSGLADNKTMTHVRIRNQNLNEDAGIIGRVLAENATLLAVDCRDNSLNLTNLRFLVDSLTGHNTTLLEFPFPAAERRAIWKTMLRGLQRTHSSMAISAQGTISHLSTAATSTPAPRNRDLLKGEESLLRSVLDNQFALLDARLRQNRAALEASAAASPNPHLLFLLDDPPPLPLPSASSTHLPNPHHPHRRTTSTASTSSSNTGIELGADDDEDRWPAFALNSTTTATTPSSGSGSGNLKFSHPTVRSSAMERDAPPSLPAPYGAGSEYGYGYGYGYQSQGRGQTQPPQSQQPQPQGLGLGLYQIQSGVESPTETLDPVSEVETPCYYEEPSEEGKGPGRAQGLNHTTSVGMGGERLAMPEGCGGGGAEGRLMLPEIGNGEGEGGEDGDELMKMISDFRKAGFEV